MLSACRVAHARIASEVDGRHGGQTLDGRRHAPTLTQRHDIVRSAVRDQYAQLAIGCGDGSLVAAEKGRQGESPSQGCIWKAERGTRGYQPTLGEG